MDNLRKEIEKILDSFDDELTTINPSDEMYEVIKASHAGKIANLISKQLAKEKMELVEKVEPAILRACEEFSIRTFENTMKGKNSPFEVTDSMWQGSSFTFEELAKKVVDSLKSEEKEEVGK